MVLCLFLGGGKRKRVVVSEPAVDVSGWWLEAVFNLFSPSVDTVNARFSWAALIPQDCSGTSKMCEACTEMPSREFLNWNKGKFNWNWWFLLGSGMVTGWQGIFGGVWVTQVRAYGTSPLFFRYLISFEQLPDVNGLSELVRIISFGWGEFKNHVTSKN